MDLARIIELEEDAVVRVESVQPTLYESRHIHGVDFIGRK